MPKKKVPKKSTIKTKNTKSVITKSTSSKSASKTIAPKRTTTRKAIAPISKSKPTLTKATISKKPIRPLKQENSIANKPRNNDDEFGLRLYAALSYCLPFILIPIFAARKNPFVSWHIKQGMVMLVFTVVMFVLLTFIAQIAVLGPIIVIGFGALWFVLFVWAIVSTLLGQNWKFPLFGEAASKINI